MARVRKNYKRPVVAVIKKKPTKMTARRVAKIAKAVNIKQSETKMSFTRNSATLKHDTVTYFQLLTNTNQGSSDSTRNGDEIYIKNLWFKMLVNGIGATSYPPTMRFMVVRTKKDTAPTDAQFLTTAGGGAKLTSFANREYCTVLYDKYFRSFNSAVNTHPEVHVKNIRIPINSKHVFDSDDSDLGKYYNYWAVVIGYISSGTVGTTDVAYFDVQHGVSFKDL